MLWSLFRKWSSVGNFLCRLSPSTRSGRCVAVHVIGVKVQDLTIAFCDNFLTSDTPRRYQHGFHFRQKGACNLQLNVRATKRFLLRQLVRVLSFSHQQLEHFFAGLVLIQNVILFEDVPLDLSLIALKRIFEPFVHQLTIFHKMEVSQRKRYVCSILFAM